MMNSRLRNWFIVAFATMATALGVVCCNTEPSSDSLGTAQQSVVTCVTVQRGVGSSVVNDLTVEQGYPTWNEGTEPTLHTGKTSATRARTLLKFDISSIPVGSSVTSANITIYTGPTVQTVNVHKVTSTWAESTTLWGTQPTYDSTAFTTFSSVAWATKTFSIMTQAQDWVNGTSNFGVLLEQDAATTSVNYSSSEAGTKPKLVVCYNPPGGTTSATTAASTTGSSGGATSSASSTVASTVASTTASTTVSTTSATTAASTTAATTSSSTTSSTSSGGSTTVLAVIGDFGAEGTGLTSVSAMVAGWNPDHVLTTGDNVYSSATDPYDLIVGQNYHQFMYPYTGAYGSGSSTSANRFWPIPGNHDWDHTNLTYYQSFFTLPTNGDSERYYHVALDSASKIRLFAMDADAREPNGDTSTSVQASWLQAAMAADTTSCFKIVDIHEPPHCSTIAASEGPDPATDWPFFTWGADLVQSGSRHGYERLSVSGNPYIVNGLGGGGLYGNWNIIDSNSVYRFPTTPQRYGAEKITVTIGGGTGTMVVQFFGVGDTTPADSYTITKTCN